jgi:hypothetical protein
MPRRLDREIIRGREVVTVGIELDQMREINGSALILAGLVSAVVLPAVAAMLLGGRTEEARRASGTYEIVQDSL